MSRTLSFDKKNHYPMGTNKIEALLVYYWERSDHMNKKKLYPMVIICNLPSFISSL